MKAEREAIKDLVVDLVIALTRLEAKRELQLQLRQGLIFAYRRGRRDGWADCHDGKAQGLLDLGLSEE